MKHCTIVKKSQFHWKQRKCTKANVCPSVELISGSFVYEFKSLEGLGGICVFDGDSDLGGSCGQRAVCVRCGPLASSFSITCDVLDTQILRAPAQSYWIKNLGGSSTQHFNKASRWLWSHKIWETLAWHDGEGNWICQHFLNFSVPSTQLRIVCCWRF